MKSKELNKLKRIFKKIPDDKKKLVEKLIENAAFMADELDKLQEYIREHGTTEDYQNGANQWGKKKSSEVEVYNTMIKNYNSTIKILVDLVPEGEDGDALMDFLKK